MYECVMRNPMHEMGSRRGGRGGKRKENGEKETLEAEIFMMEVRNREREKRMQHRKGKRLIWKDLKDKEEWKQHEKKENVELDLVTFFSSYFSLQKKM